MGGGGLKPPREMDQNVVEVAGKDESMMSKLPYMPPPAIGFSTIFMKSCCMIPALVALQLSARSYADAGECSAIPAACSGRDADREGRKRGGKGGAGGVSYPMQGSCHRERVGGCGCEGGFGVCEVAVVSRRPRPKTYLDHELLHRHLEHKKGDGGGDVGYSVARLLRRHNCRAKRRDADQRHHIDREDDNLGVQVGRKDGKGTNPGRILRTGAGVGVLCWDGAEASQAGRARGAITQPGA